MNEWIRSTFDTKNTLYERAFTPTQEQTELEAQFIVEFASLDLQSRVIDVCCGSGRHVHCLTRLGYSVDGIDISSASIDVATGANSSLTTEIPRPRFYVDDARDISQNHPEPANTYEVALNLFSSFGYYSDEKEQVAMLKGINHALKPQGSLLLDIPNKDFILNTFTNESVFSLNELEGHVVRRYDDKKSRIETRTTINGVGINEFIDTAMSLYSYVDISRLLEDTGYSIKKSARGFTGEEFDPKNAGCERIILLAKKL